MNLLIVDDEYFSVENMKTKLDWKALNFEQVFCAYSMAQAQEVFKAHIIDVLLCDIEMPKGSGLDLLEWVRAQNYCTVCIFLTCFSEFSYANKALQLESSDYLLKPVESIDLLNAINKAIDKRRQSETAQINELRAEYWLSNDMQRCSNFWQTIVESEKELSWQDINNNLS
ncbi:MAG: response regulator, partial [Christensenella sp.]